MNTNVKTVTRSVKSYWLGPKIPQPAVSVTAKTWKNYCRPMHLHPDPLKTACRALEILPAADHPLVRPPIVPAQAVAVGEKWTDE